MEKLEWVVSGAEKGVRLDRYLAEKVTGKSRTMIQQEIRAGRVFADGVPVEHPSQELRGGEHVVWESDQNRSSPHDLLRCPSSTRTRLFWWWTSLSGRSPTLEREARSDSREGLLVDRSLPLTEDPARPGIVHRLDKETSGLIVVAKTKSARLSEGAVRRTPRPEGVPRAGTRCIDEDEGAIDAPIARDPPTRGAWRCVLKGGRQRRSSACWSGERRRPCSSSSPVRDGRTRCASTFVTRATLSLETASTGQVWRNGSSFTPGGSSSLTR